jgi:hypothetical protein
LGRFRFSFPAIEAKNIAQVIVLFTSPNWLPSLARSHAMKAVSTNGVAVMPTTLDLEFTETPAPDQLDQLETSVLHQVGGRVRDLQLSVRDGGIVLRGVARTFHAKQVAQHAVMRNTDIPIAANEINVC